MGLFKNLKAMKDAVAAGMSGEGPSAEALASLSPEQRAAYDAQMAQVAAAQQEASANHAQIRADHADRVASRPLHGPAGEHVYGSTELAGLSPDEVAAMSSAELMAWQTQMTKAQFKDVLTNPFGRKDPPPPPAGAPTGPFDRGTQAAAEREARTQAHVPYLAPRRAPFAIARLATRGKSQVEEVVAYLASSGFSGRPDLVYGVYRVPDRISPGMSGSEKGRVVEWDVVHAATEPLHPSEPPASVGFAAEECWVHRTIGQPSVLDEDLAVAYLLHAGIGPERCLGVARVLTITGHGGDEGETSYVLTQVKGVHAFHPGEASSGSYTTMAEQKPLALPFDGPTGVWSEVLNWEAIRRAVQPSTAEPALVPSPFPYLPSSPQELLRSYLEVVGVLPGDCYSAQVTEDEAGDLTTERTGKFGFTYSSNMGTSQPCADGKERRRLIGGSHVVITYRDRPEYAEGRTRWNAYETQVLQATLANGTGKRRPVEPPAEDGVPRGLRGLVKAIEVVDRIVDPVADDPFADIPPHRYCWPPQRAT